MLPKSPQVYLSSQIRLEDAIRRCEITVKDLYTSVSFSRQYLYRLMTGQQDLGNARGRVLVELSRILKVSTDYLLGVEADDALAAGHVHCSCVEAMMRELEEHQRAESFGD